MKSLWNAICNLFGLFGNNGCVNQLELWYGLFGRDA